jgi:hypothetical protein
MIILEGPDGGGKTTLLNRLQADLSIKVAPRVVSKEAKAMTDLVEWVHENLRQGFQPKLYDRHRLISEPIYGPALRNDLEQGFDDPLWLNEMLFRLYFRVKPVLIYCLPPFDEVWKNVMSDEDNSIFHGWGGALKHVYWAYFNKALTDHVLYNGSCWIYDYTSPHAEEKYMTMLHSLQHRLNPEDTHV